MQKVVVGIVALIVGVAGTYVLLTSTKGPASMMQKDADEMMKADAMPAEGKSVPGGMNKSDEDGHMMSEGTYEAYAPEKLAFASDGRVVLYFHADWCPTCRPLDAAFKASVPAGIHILKVDYDTATELKQKYGVTYQHTFVQVDESGKSLAKWGDAFTAADVYARVQ